MVQAARKWWKSFIKTLKDKLGFKEFQSNSCLLKKNNENQFVAVGTYIDDCLINGDNKAINYVVKEIKEHYDLTTEDVHDFVGCTLEKKESAVYLHQPDLIKKMLNILKGLQKIEGL